MEHKTFEQLSEIVKKLVAAGWIFKSHSYEPAAGWWVLPTGNTTQAMRRGDPRPFYQTAQTTWELYVER